MRNTLAQNKDGLIDAISNLFDCVKPECLDVAQTEIEHIIAFTKEIERKESA